MTNNLFLMLLLVGIIYIIVGLIMVKFPPKKINSIYGYRTRRSTKNQKNWDFAQKYSAIEMIKLGSLFCIVSIIAYLYPIDDNSGLILGSAIHIAAVIILFLRVENALKNNDFGE